MAMERTSRKWGKSWGMQDWKGEALIRQTLDFRSRASALLKRGVEEGRNKWGDEWVTGEVEFRSSAIRNTPAAIAATPWFDEIMALRVQTEHQRSYIRCSPTAWTRLIFPAAKTDDGVHKCGSFGKALACGGN